VKMPSVSISEAARLAGVSRRTIQRRAQAGAVTVSQSVTGEKMIDISELVRVFGDLPGRPIQPAHVTMSHHVQDNVTALEARITVLEAELLAKDALLEAQRENLADMRQALKLLEGQPRRRWWQFGR